MVRVKIVSMKQEFVPMTRFGSFLLIILGEKKDYHYSTRPLAINTGRMFAADCRFFFLLTAI